MLNYKKELYKNSTPYYVRVISREYNSHVELLKSVLYIDTGVVHLVAYLVRVMVSTEERRRVSYGKSSL